MSGDRYSQASCLSEEPANHRRAYEQYVRKLSNGKLIQRLDQASDLLDLGARIRISIDGAEQEMTSVQELPDDPFEIAGIDFSESILLTNNTMTILRGLHDVRELKLSGVPITGTGALRGMSMLQSLWLDRTRVKGIGLLQVKHLQSLRRLNLAGTDVRDDDVRAIREALPGCLIQR